MAYNIEKAPDPLIGRSIARGQYRIEELRAEGDLGRVYRGVHERLRQPVEIWMLHGSHARDASLRAQFQRAGRSAGRVDHPNVVEIYDLGRDPDGSLFLVREDLGSSNLRTLLAGGRRVTPGSVVHVMTQVAGGVGAAHAAGVVHRDLRPANIAIVEQLDDENETVAHAKVLDFTHARSRAGNGDDEAGGLLSGHPKYMSPEHGAGRPLDARSDVYACGCIAYRLATGVPPFQGSPVDILARRQTENPIPPSGLNPAIPAALDTVILRALEKDPDRRYQTGGELRSALEATGIRPAVADRAIAMEAAPVQKKQEALAEEEISVEIEDGELPSGDSPKADALVGSRSFRRALAILQERSPGRLTTVFVVLVCVAIAAGLGLVGL